MMSKWRKPGVGRSRCPKNTRGAGRRAEEGRGEGGGEGRDGKERGEKRTLQP